MSEDKTSQTAFLLINGNQIYYLEDNETTIGRSSESDLVISDPRISRKHAKISIVNDRYLLTDLNSSGGSYINGKPAVQKLLASGDELTFAFGLRIIFGVDASMIPDDSVPYSAIEILEAGAASLTFFAQPVVGAVLGVTLLGEQLTPLFFVGGVMIGLGLWLGATMNSAVKGD